VAPNDAPVVALTQTGGATGSQEPVQFVRAVAASAVADGLTDLLSQCIIPRQIQVDQHEKLIDDQAHIIAQQASRLIDLEQRVRTLEIFSDQPAIQP
jgi:hypothetical protein